MLELLNVGKSLGGRVIIESASLSLAEGEIICLTGPSGVGKTTLLEIMAGVIRPDKGTLKRCSGAALMFQDDVLIPWLTAEDAVRYILPPFMAEREQRERTAFWLDKFGLEPGMYPAAMSGGMRRRLSIARTFAAGRRLVLLDEPFAFLDEGYCRLIAEETVKHARAGCGVVMTSHTAAPLEYPVFSQATLRFAEVNHTPVSIHL